VSAHLELAELTRGQPFCAGVVLWHRRRMVFALAKPSRWAPAADGWTGIDVMCVGGGQEVGETVEECARREALEETGRPVLLRSAARTRWRGLDGTVSEVRLADPIAPLAVELRPGPRSAYRPGLPTGPVLYVVHYLADLLDAPVPGDVPALIEVPVGVAPGLRSRLTVREALDRGVVLHERQPVPREAVLVTPPNSPEWSFVGMVDALTDPIGSPG
jgi:8-oxo-dGTP pyrophosphatase MutT (NUDIX family)